MTSPDGPSGRDGPDPQPRGPALGEIGRHAGHGLTIALSTALFAWLGDGLDGRLGTTPLFVLSGAAAGFGAGFYSMYRQLAASDGSESTDVDGGGERADDLRDDGRERP